MPWLKILYCKSPETRCIKSTPPGLSQCLTPISLRCTLLSRNGAAIGRLRNCRLLLCMSTALLYKPTLFSLFQPSVNCPLPHWFSLQITCMLSTNLGCKRCRSSLHFERWARRNSKMISFIYRAPKLQPNLLLMKVKPVDCETGH
ncbi:putative Nudix hydrolase P35G2.12 [Fusarium oxysporum f. sp. albedinis]|nr:putative Nudix hydrolase P35G2.12 [Fusarium oxysporum f. sp. albedinis]